MLEDKGNLAFLQLKMNCPVLPTYVAHDRTDVLKWAKNRWDINVQTTVFNLSNISSEDWWVVKASRGNGGKDVWFMNANNYLSLCGDVDMGEHAQSFDSHESLPVKEELVIQK